MKLNNLKQIHLKPFSKGSTKAEVTVDLIGNKVADEITKASKISSQNILEKVTNECHKEIPKELYISPEEIQKIDGDLRLI